MGSSRSCIGSIKVSPLWLHDATSVGSGTAERVCGLERTREGATMGNFNFSY